MADQLNVFMGQSKPVETETTPRIRSVMIMPKAIETKLAGDSLFTIKRGLATDRPTTGDIYPFYFATDTFVLSAWTGDVWKTTTLA